MQQIKLTDNPNALTPVEACPVDHMSRETPRATPRPTPPEESEVGPVFYTVEELAALGEDKTSYLVDGLLSMSGSSLLIGKPKSGKSQLARQLAAAVASGSPFLGRETQQGEVIYFALEEKQSEVDSHFRLLGVTGGVKTAFSGTRASPLDSLGKALIASPDAKLIIVDTLAMFATAKDWDKYGEVGRVLGPIHRFARDHKLHLLLVHHAGKRERETVGDNAIGSTALSGGVDTLMQLTLEGENRVFKATPRYAAAIPRTTLKLDRETLSVSVGEEMGKQDNSARITADITALLQRNGPSTQQEITDAVTGKTITITATLEMLRSCGFIKRDGTGRGGSPFQFSISPIPSEREIEVGGAADGSH